MCFNLGPPPAAERVGLEAMPEPRPLLLLTVALGNLDPKEERVETVEVLWGRVVQDRVSGTGCEEDGGDNHDSKDDLCC